MDDGPIHSFWYLIPAAFQAALVVIAGLIALGIVHAVQKRLAARRQAKPTQK